MTNRNGPALLYRDVRVHGSRATKTNSSENLIDHLERIGTDNFMDRADLFHKDLDPNLHAVMIREDIGQGFYTNPPNSKIMSDNSDLFDRNNNMICAGRSDEELQQFLRFMAMSDEEKLLCRARAIEELLNPYNNSLNTVFRWSDGINDYEIPAGITGLAPDFSTIREALNTDFPIIKIVATGSREKDKEVANILRNALLSGVTPEDFMNANRSFILPAESGFDWHHLDDWDPTNGKMTMQLVKNEFHRGLTDSLGNKINMGHIGSPAIWKRCTKLGYIR